MGAMRLTHVPIAVFSRWLRCVVAVTLIVNGALASPAIALPHATAHCQPSTQHLPAPGNDAPASHPCCAQGSCACGAAFACVAFPAAPVTHAFAGALLIPEAALSAIPQGDRSPLLRPPIS
jgi:hypothetical protein